MSKDSKGGELQPRYNHSMLIAGRPEVHKGGLSRSHGFYQTAIPPFIGEGDINPICQNEGER